MAKHCLPLRQERNPFQWREPVLAGHQVPHEASLDRLECEYRTCHSFAVTARLVPHPCSGEELQVARQHQASNTSERG